MRRIPPVLGRFRCVFGVLQPTSSATLEYFETFCKNFVDYFSKSGKTSEIAMVAPSPTTHRAVVEHMVRQAVYQRLGRPMPTAVSAPNPLLVNVSARHCHLTQEAVETLFGKGHQLTVHKWLYQDGQFAAKETLTLIGPRSRVISNLRIL